MLKRVLFIGLILSVFSLLTLGSRLEAPPTVMIPLVVEPMGSYRSPASQSEANRIEIIPLTASEL